MVEPPDGDVPELEDVERSRQEVRAMVLGKECPRPIASLAAFEAPSASTSLSLQTIPRKPTERTISHVKAPHGFAATEPSLLLGTRRLS